MELITRETKIGQNLLPRMQQSSEFGFVALTNEHLDATTGLISAAELSSVFHPRYHLLSSALKLFYLQLPVTSILKFSNQI